MTAATSNGKKYIVGITDFLTPPIEAEERAFPEAGFRFLPDWKSSPAARLQWRECDALLIWHHHIDRDTAAILDNCKIVVRYGAGHDVVDVPALMDKGIRFSNTPGCGTTEVADTACAMILSLQRKVAAYDRDCRGYTDRWQQTLPRLRRTSTRTLGIIGAGRIGTAVMERMRAFGCRIVFFDPSWQADGLPPDGCCQVESLDDLLEASDIISIHCPLTKGTRGLVNADFLARMKSGASLVNTARGGILADLDCLEAALKSGRLASAAMDVLPSEPPQEHPLLTAWRQDAPWLAGRLVITPHVADYSEEGWDELHYKTAETARLFLVEGRQRFAVTA